MLVEIAQEITIIIQKNTDPPLSTVNYDIVRNVA